jgi:hypothetical protein
MSQHKIVKIPDWVLPEAETYLNDVGKDGWDLVHVYNQHAYMKSSAEGTISSGSLSVATDAFGRQRVSETHTLGDYKHLYAIDFNFLDFTASGATNTFNANRASVTLQTSASISSRAVHQTKMYHNYMPGKSQLILSSVKFGAAQPGVTKRTGYFDDYNGIFFEQDATGSLSFVIRSATNGTGSLQENRVYQSNWNVNQINSGDFVLDITKTQLVWFDFQWLAVGRVRCGVVHQGAFVLCHVFDHSNYIDAPYMSNPNLPVRCEILNSTTATGSMEQICCSVMSEGGYVESGTTWALTSPSLRTITSASSTPVMAIRLKNSYNGLPNRAFVRMSNLSVFSEDQTVKYRLIKLPQSSSLTGGSWVSVNNASTVEYNVTAVSSSLATERELLNGFVFAGGTGVGNAIAGIGNTPGVDTKINYIAQNYDSTDSEIYALVVTNMTSTNTDVGVGMTWKEVF